MEKTMANSKIPDFKEITGFASKLFTDVTKSVKEIISDYKQKHPTTPTAAAPKPEAKPEAKPVAKKEDKKPEPPEGP